jgi:hypothetical protein
MTMSHIDAEISARAMTMGQWFSGGGTFVASLWHLWCHDHGPGTWDGQHEMTVKLIA